MKLQRTQKHRLPAAAHPRDHLRPSDLYPSLPAAGIDEQLGHKPGAQRLRVVRLVEGAKAADRLLPRRGGDLERGVDLPDQIRKLWRPLHRALRRQHARELLQRGRQPVVDVGAAVGLLEQAVGKHQQMKRNLVHVARLLFLVAPARVGHRPEIDGYGKNSRVDRFGSPLIRWKGADEDVAAVQVVVESLLVLELGQQPE